MSKATKITAACVVALTTLVVVGYFLIMGAGKPIGTDLSVIAQGKPALVLAYENFSPVGGAALNGLREVGSDYESKIVFVVADLGTPLGQTFAKRYQLADGQAVFLDKNGHSPQVMNIPTDINELRAALDSGLVMIK